MSKVVSRLGTLLKSSIRAHFSPRMIQKFPVVVLGGTFDRLHDGHKLLLTEAVNRCACKLIVGVTDESMIQKKSLCELIQPIDVRIGNVVDFLQNLAPKLVHRVVPIADPFGPAIVDENIQLIVVSDETKRGADRINEIRKEKNFNPLLIHTIPLLEDSARQSEIEEEKISSSSHRIRLLGQRLQPPLKPASLPYIIGLTGGIASGKTSVCKYLEETHNIPTINCDKLGHEAYQCGTRCFAQLISTFGSDILTPEGHIDRRAVGAKVFGNTVEMKKLTDIVWPEIARLAQNKIAAFVENGAKIVVVDAAVLIEAGWDSMCHEVWVSFVPRDVAISRIQERDNLTPETAAQRVDSQLSNNERLKKATFAFSSLWETDFTRSQVSKALSEIQSIVNAIE